ncbi:TPA: carbohydrate ABC transporter permease [bacterium]|nr:carbohydrate ABC transporter permease [bacterium]
MNIRKIIPRIVVYILVIAGSIAFIIPFIWTVSTAFKPDDQIFLFPPKWIPEPPTTIHFREVFEFVPFGLLYRNTVILTLLNIAGTLFSCPLAAYAFAKLRWPGRDLIFLITLATMMLPSQVTMIPQFLIFRNLGWLNTMLPLWFPSFFGNAFNIFLLRQFFMTLPKELDDAARIDGCSFFGIFWRINLPLIIPAVTTVTIFTFMGTWNNFIGPLIYVRSYDAMPLSLGLRMFQEAYSAEWGALMAASLMMILPVILVFFFLQKYFVQGISLTGLKG